MEFKDIMLDLGKSILRGMVEDLKSGKMTEELLNAKRKTQIKRGEIIESLETEHKIQELRERRLEKQREEKLEKQRERFLEKQREKELEKQREEELEKEEIEI